MTYPNYLATHRKRWALTKQELAHLLGYRSRASVARCEVALQEPTVRLLLGCEVVFGLAGSVLFPALYDEIEDLVMQRALVLDTRLGADEGQIADRKRELLLQMVSRATSRPLV